MLGLDRVRGAEHGCDLLRLEERAGRALGLRGGRLQLGDFRHDRPLAGVAQHALGGVDEDSDQRAAARTSTVGHELAGAVLLEG